MNYTEEQLKEIATEFFYSWYNSPGTNTQEGFDTWWQLHKARFTPPVSQSVKDKKGIAHLL